MKSLTHSPLAVTGAGMQKSNMTTTPINTTAISKRACATTGAVAQATVTMTTDRQAITVVIIIISKKP